MDTSRLETGVLSILTGARLEAVAAEVGVPIITLSHAAKTYQAAGQAALDYAVRSSPWRHVSVIIDGRQEAEKIGITYLAPALEELRADGAITGWWYMRKAGHWRIRYLPNPERGETATRMLAYFLDGLASDQTIRSWSPGIYEPELELFGGPAAMDIAHLLFSVDSACILRYLGGPAPLGRRELMVLLPTVLARAAGLDWFEQGQMWHEVAQGRPAAVDQARVEALSPAVRTLLRADIDTKNARLRAVAGLATSYAEAGRALRTLMARDGLSRGLRAICSTHAVFSANRLGVAYEEQAQLAETARQVILGCLDTNERPTSNASPATAQNAQPTIRVIVAAAIIKDGRVLACQRTRPHALAGLWEFPGGRVEPGESETDALARECREELNIEIKVGIRIGDDTPLSNGEAVLRIYTAELVHGLPTLTEHGDLRWLAADELDAVPWVPADAPTAQALSRILR